MRRFRLTVRISQNVAQRRLLRLFALQHRGQESCGIVVNDDGVFTSYKDAGIVNDVFTADALARLGEGNMAVGHVRYGTTGSTGAATRSPSSSITTRARWRSRTTATS